ncbi:hypothetical protein NDU88_000539 [Pleurodeles waltl]|uniref:SGNH hydrolase-type esterase domain-containing protein n=1 Tax=Pleurodeles waltl TaxID=8319 RepID=A0AAV7LDC9_PLEWA|nr:hypothetical protein NDU88_000539 [Pleurodeles waltl]
MVGDKCRVRLIGHSYIMWVQQWMAVRKDSGDMWFKNTEVFWLGRLSMRCAQLIPNIERALQRRGRPEAVVVHLGGNDLVDLGQKDLLTALVMGLTAVSRLQHPADIVQSEIIATPFWKGRLRDQWAMGRSRQTKHNHVKNLQDDFLGLGESWFRQSQNTRLLRARWCPLIDPGHGHVCVKIDRNPGAMWF